jgi:hypothetical protein
MFNWSINYKLVEETIWDVLEEIRGFKNMN